MFIHKAAKIHYSHFGLNRSERTPVLNVNDQNVKKMLLSNQNVIIHLLGQKYIDYSERPGQSKEVIKVPKTPEKKSKPRTKPCVVCTKNKTCKETRYFCPLCPKTLASYVVDFFKV